MNRSVFLLVVLVITTGCGQRVDVETRSDPSDELGESYGRSATISSESDFERAERFVREGDHVGAIAIYRTIYRTAASSDDRAEALYEWARVEGNLLNPDRDLDGAIARLELLLEEFPEASVAFRAREELNRLRTFQGQAGRPRG